MISLYNGDRVYRVANSKGMYMMDYLNEQEMITVNFISFALIREAVKVSEGVSGKFWKHIYGNMDTEVIKVHGDIYKTVEDIFLAGTDYPFENLTMEQLANIARVG